MEQENTGFEQNPEGDAAHLYPVDFTPFGTQEEARLKGGFEADTLCLWGRHMNQARFHTQRG